MPSPIQHFLWGCFCSGKAATLPLSPATLPSMFSCSSPDRHFLLACALAAPCLQAERTCSTAPGFAARAAVAMRCCAGTGAWAGQRVWHWLCARAECPASLKLPVRDLRGREILLGHSRTWEQALVFHFLGKPPGVFQAARLSTVYLGP